MVSPTMGGAFGGKMESSVELIPAALAMLCRRPVKFTATRRECMVSTRVRHASVITVKTGVKTTAPSWHRRSRPSPTPEHMPPAQGT